MDVSPAKLAELQALLEGVDLPASKSVLVEYARRQGGPPSLLAALESVPDGEYCSLDDVAETLRPVQPAAPQVLPPEPEPESGAPPGSADYTKD